MATDRSHWQEEEWATGQRRLSGAIGLARNVQKRVGVTTTVEGRGSAGDVLHRVFETHLGEFLDELDARGGDLPHMCAESWTPTPF